jgi:pyruvate dehydrogenase E2 component (dihydrolipoamide acetyltransferase)
VEVETDKTNVEIEAPASGILRKIVVAAGTDGVAVGAVLATIDDAPGAVVAPLGTRIETRAANARPEPAEAASAEPPAVDDPPRHSRRAPLAAEIDATPVARKIATLGGVDLSTITPAAGGRITKADVEIVLGGRATPPARDRSRAAAARAAAAPPALSAMRAPFEDQPLSTLRRVTAARLLEAKQTIPHFYLQTECRVDALMRLRTQWNERRPGAKISVTDLLVFASSRALRQVPLANSAWVESAVRVYAGVDIAVAVNTPRGLIAPVVRECQRKTLGAISQEVVDLARRARDGRLQPDEYTGATFTISNLGMFGVTSIIPIVNPPSACILGVGAIEERAVVVDHQIVAGHTLVCALAADHRAIDGATGAEFMTELRRRLEDPLSMALEA